LSRFAVGLFTKKKDTSLSSSMAVLPMIVKGGKELSCAPLTGLSLRPVPCGADAQETKKAHVTNKAQTNKLRRNVPIGVFILISSEFPGHMLTFFEKRNPEEKMEMMSKKPDIRERVKKLGAKHLSDYELLAVTLRTGTHDTPVMSLAARVIKELDTARPDAVYETL